MWRKLLQRLSPKKDDIYAKLLRDRIIFLGTPIDDDTAQDVISRILFLQNQDAASPITLYINSPGGSVTASLAILDTIASLKNPVHTVCIGFAAGTAALLVAAGAKGQRFTLPNSEFGFATTRGGNSSHDAQTTESLLAKLNDRIVAEFAKHCDQLPERIAEDMASERYFDVGEAMRYGLVDQVVTRPLHTS